MSSNTYQSFVKPVEFLAATLARVHGRNAVVLAMQPEHCSSFRSEILSITRSQAVRLRDDLSRMLDYPQSFWSDGAAVEETEEEHK